ncbi:MAG: precorrin-6y C5,15-methyltransferase (decarboxylating) subunit CbiE [Bacteroidales bacterium]|nr:precorrin-6y C5,15-methyltransferase (decarboxylating) subunit CbiE [Bacteroidales bacterium]
MRTCSIIGISDSRQQWFSPEITAVIVGGRVFSGGKRHHEIMQDFLPVDALWLDITVPLNQVFERYEQYEDIIVFASGDPLFYGFASTVQRVFPDCEMKVYPAFHSLQTLAHRLNMPYHEMHAVSLTGRPWDAFDEALIRGEVLIGCLTDRNKTPHAIWQRMLQYGYTNYEMIVGENLGNEDKERVSRYNEHVAYSNPNCLILKQKYPRERVFGIPDDQFHLLNGRKKMITKMPIRLSTIAALQLANKSSFWDVGFCTGSISIEAKLLFPCLHVTSFEVREEGRELMILNSQKFGTPGIHTIIEDFCTTDFSHLQSPDAVFIGGHGGKLKEMIVRIHAVLNPHGCIVFNSVSSESCQAFIEGVENVGMTCEEWATITVNDFHPITILKAYDTH